MKNKKPSEAWSVGEPWKKALLLPIFIIALYLGLAVSSPNFHTLAAINEVINFQGKLVNSDGTNITDGSYYFKVEILDAAVGGSSLAAAEYKYTSTASSVSNTSVVYTGDTDEATMKVGMVIWNTTDGDYAIIESIDTGTNTLTLDRDVDSAPYAWAATDAITTKIQLNDGIFNIKVVNISSLAFDTDSYYVSVQFDSTPGGGDALNETFSPRKRLDAVPYALRSKYSDELGGVSSSQFLRSDESDNYTVGTLAFDVGTTLDVNGDLTITDTAIAFDGVSTDFTMTGDLTVNTDDLFVEKATGDIGVGDTSPDHKLDVSGNIGLSASGYINWGDTDGDSGYGFKDNGGTLQFKNSSGSWTNFGAGSSLWTASSSDIYYNSGNVGIGTSGPFNERLHLNGRLYLADSTVPSPTTNRLYSLSGVLYWNGIAISSGLVSGWAAPVMVFQPEYEGAVLSADGGDNAGTMTSDNTGSAGSWMNYYEFVSSEASLNDYDIRVRFILPADFNAWDTNAIVFDYVTESVTNTDNKVDYSVYLESSGSADDSDTANVSGVAGTWTTTTIAGANLGDCNAAGETCLLVIQMYSKDDNYVRVGDITFDYTRP